MQGKVWLLAALFWIGVLMLLLHTGEEETLNVTVFDLDKGSEEYRIALLAKLRQRQEKGAQRTLPSSRKSTCSEIDFLRLFPELRGTLNSTSKSLVLESTCFRSISMTLSYGEPSSLTLTIHTGNSVSFLCYETLIFIVFGRYFPDVIFMGGTHVYEFRPLTPKALGSFDYFGLKVFTLCADPAELLKDGFILANIFSDMVTEGRYGRRPGLDTAEPAILSFLNTSMGYELTLRPQTQPELVPKIDIHSGDLFGIMEIEGAGGFIMYSTGARLSHLAMALWMPYRGVRTLFVVESNYFGIMRTQYADWIKASERLNFGVILMPLKPEYSMKFNESAAVNFYWQTARLPYGWETFLFGWIDTPTGNFPTPLTSEVFLLTLYIMEQSKPKEAEKLFLAGLNKRLNTSNLSFIDLAKEVARRNSSLPELFAVPEREDWTYGGNSSMVCSAYAVKMYKVAGTFVADNLQAMELTPRDVYTLDLFDKSASFLSKCKVNDPGLNYCQIVGRLRIQLGQEYSSLPLTAHRFDSCPSQPPLYYRPPGC